MPKRHSFRFFVHERVPDFFDDVRDGGRDLMWWVLHRIHPKHRFHVVDTGLKPGYYDPCSQMFHASFNLLREFVEYNLTEDTIEWDSDEGHRHAWKEMNSLVDWYCNDRPKRQDKFDREHPQPVDLLYHSRIIEDDSPNAKRVKEYLELASRFEMKCAQEDEDNFIRLVKIRNYIWYA